MRTAYYKKALRPIKRVAASGVVATKVSEDWRQTLGTLPAVAKAMAQPGEVFDEDVADRSNFSMESVEARIIVSST